jgi:hypothetical protein
MARAKAAKAESFDGAFVVVVGRGQRTLDVPALRAEIGAWLAHQPLPPLTGCRTIAGPGTVVICQGECSRPHEICDVKPMRRPGGGYTYECKCQVPIVQQTRTAPRRAAARKTTRK